MHEDEFQSQLEELSGKLLLKVGGISDREPTAEQWANTFQDVTPKQLYAKFAHAGGADNSVKVKVVLYNGEKLPEVKSTGKFQVLGITRHTVIEVRHNASWYDHERKNSMVFFVNEDGSASLYRAFFEEQSQSLAKRYLHTGVELLKGIGTKTMTMEAIEVGTYAWPKYGFTPATPDDWERMKFFINQRFNYEEGNVQFKGTAYDVSLERNLIQRVLNTDFSELPELLPHLTELNRVIGEHKDRPLTVGKALLLDLEKYNAVLPLDESSKSFQRFKTYTAIAAEQLKERV